MLFSEEAPDLEGTNCGIPIPMPQSGVTLKLFTEESAKFGDSA